MTAEEYLTERNAMHEQLFPTARLLPGVERLIRHLKASKIPIAVSLVDYSYQ
jgi:pseudouridine-5'-monophosphatase